MEFSRNTHRKIMLGVLITISLLMISMVTAGMYSNVFNTYSEKEILNIIHDATNQLPPEQKSLILSYTDKQIISIIKGTPEGETITASFTKAEKNAAQSLGNIIKSNQRQSIRMPTASETGRVGVNSLRILDITYLGSPSGGNTDCQGTKPNGCWPEDGNICSINDGGTKACIWANDGTAYGCKMISSCPNAICNSQGNACG